MPESKYRAVIVGLTGIGAGRPADNPKLPLYGRMPGSHAAAYQRHPQTEVVAVCDIRDQALQDFRSQWRDVWPDVRVYTDYRQMLEQEKPDLISVATPDHLHADITVAAAERGAKAVLCEKPIATSLEDADRMIEACERNHTILSVEHTRRWDPLFLKAREIVRSGDIGPLRTVLAELFSGRAMLFRNGTHLIDLICFFAEAAPQWLVGELEAGFDHFTEYRSDGGHDPAKDPFASAYIHYANGVRAFLNAYKTKFEGSLVVLTCDQGRIEVSDRGAAVIRSKSHGEWAVSNLPVERYQCERQLAAVSELIHAVEHGGQLVSSGREARRTLEIMLGILKSHHRGNQRVNLSGQ